MKKFDMNKLDKSYLKICCYIFFLAAAVILFEKVIGHLSPLGSILKTFLTTIVRFGAPFFLGFAIAYIMNPIMNFFERHIFKFIPGAQKQKKVVRALCILFNYIIIIGGLVWIVIYLIPELKASVVSFVGQIPVYSAELNQRITDFFNQIDFIDAKDVTDMIDKILRPVWDAFQNVQNFLPDIAANLYSVGKMTIGVSINVIMAIFIAFYMLFDKENFSKQAHKISYALFNQKKAEKMLFNFHRIHRIFQDFIVGKAIDSTIIGVLAFVGLTLLKAPYPLILSLIIGVTNMIPYFGPFIGAIPAAIITFLISPITAIWVILFILALQQFDGNYLGPKILGDSLDLSPIWIIMAVVVGGATLGPLGMFIGVPILATIKMFSSEYINRKYMQKYETTDPLAILGDGDSLTIPEDKEDAPQP